MLLSLFLAAFALAVAQKPAQPVEIFRCTDVNGSVTYQQEKCPAAGKSSRVDTQETGRSFDLPAREQAWAKAAQEHRVLTGMPRRWVREALGTPAQMHLGAEDGATETWEYDSAAGASRVGFRDGLVLWTRDRRTVKLSPDSAGASRASPPARAAESGSAGSAGSTSAGGDALNSVTGNGSASSAPHSVTGNGSVGAGAEASPSAPPAASPVPASAPAIATPSLPDPVRAAERRQAVALGNDCATVTKDLGPADQDSGSAPPSPLALLRAGAPEPRDLVYEPAAGDPGVRTRIRCAGGKVTAVERSHVP